MKQQNSAKKTSRRSFAKAITSPLIITPLASALGSSHPSKDRNSSSAEAHITTKKTSSSAVVKDHIPPLIISDGSLEVEAHNLQAVGTSAGQHRMYKYKLQISGNRKLDRVKMIVIHENKNLKGGVDVSVSTFNGANQELKIYLEREDNPGSGSYNPVNPNDHQIGVRNEIIAGIPQLVVETDQPLENPRPGHQRPEMIKRDKFDHKGYSGKLYRIQKVEAIGGTPRLSDLPNVNDRVKVILMVWSIST